jgi:O-antigen/teichoic acid export membrane protein
MFLPAFAVGLITFIWQQPIIRLLNYQSTDYSGHVFGLVMLCFVPLALMYVYGTLLTANGSMKILNILAGIGLFLNICLNLWLIPIYQAWGAAVAAIVTQGFVGVSNFVYGKKLLGIRFEPNFSRSILISMMMIVGLGLTLYFFEINWIFGSTLIILSTLCLLFYFKMIDVKQAFALLKSRNE